MFQSLHSCQDTSSLNLAILLKKKKKKIQSIGLLLTWLEKRKNLVPLDSLKPEVATKNLGFSFNFNANGMVQESIEMSQYHLSAEQAEEHSTVKEVPKIVTLATRYSKCEVHLNQ